MTKKGHNSGAFAHEYRKRMLRLLDALDEIKADIDELNTEAKAKGEKVPELQRWVKAEHRDKIEKHAASVAAAVSYGEALGHEIGDAPKSEEKKPSQVRKHSKESPPSQGPHRETPAPAPAAAVVSPEPEPEASQDAPARNGGPAAAEAPAETPAPSSSPRAEFRETKPVDQLLDESLEGAAALGLGHKPAPPALTLIEGGAAAQAAAPVSDEPEIASF